MHHIIESPKAIPFLFIFVCSTILFVIENSANRNSALCFKFRCKDSRVNCQMRIRSSRNPAAEYSSREHEISISKVCLVIYSFYNRLPIIESKIVLHQSRFQQGQRICICLSLKNSFCIRQFKIFQQQIKGRQLCRFNDICILLLNHILVHRLAGRHFFCFKCCRIKIALWCKYTLNVLKA